MDNRYQWSDNALSYGIAADDVSIVTTVLPSGQVVVMNTTVRSASFDIGYRCYTRMETTNKDYDPEEDERQKVEITKHKGFYSSESMSVGIAETIESLFNIGGDDLSGWIWEEKPYGLLEPFKKFSNESGN